MVAVNVNKKKLRVNLCHLPALVFTQYITNWDNGIYHLYHTTIYISCGKVNLILIQGGLGLLTLSLRVTRRAGHARTLF